MHESDQASILLGSLRLAQNDASWINPGFYEYGNYFMSYWILAGIFKLLPHADPLLLGNATSLGIFGLGVLVLLFSIRRASSPSRAVAIFSALAAPAVLVHLPYLAPNFISAGFLFAGAGLFNISTRFFPASVFLWVLAFCCRMDGLLLVPLLAWLSADRCSFKQLIRSGRSWSIAGCGMLVLLVGRFLNGQAPSLVYSPFFIPKIYFAFLLFGAGGAAFLFILLLWRLFREGAVQAEADSRFFWWAAPIALLVPFVFYSVFMFSTRHWVVLIAGLLLLVCSGQTEQWWNKLTGSSAVLLLCSLFPLVAGIQLPFTAKPRLTVKAPTLFPTTDGRCPMGAVLPFMFSELRMDHNNQTWEAARSVEHWDEFKGKVPLGSFQLFDIVRLAVFLRGQQTNERGENLAEAPFFYFSSRALLKPEVRMDEKLAVFSGVRIEDFAMEKVTGSFPVCILKLKPVQKGVEEIWPELKKTVFFLHQIFRGNEFKWLGTVSSGSFRAAPEGHPLVFFSQIPFTVTVSGEVLEAEYMQFPEPGGGMYYVHLQALQHEKEDISVSPSVCCCTTIYPEYMSLKKIQPDMELEFSHAESVIY
jgi:hypothetical protein